MFKGIRAASSGESYNLAEMLQKRVVGQFGTLIVIIGSFTYFVMRDPNATKRAEMEAHSISQRGEGSLLNFIVCTVYCTLYTVLCIVNCVL